MTDIDTSSYANALGKPINPLQMYGQAQDIANAQAQNALLRQELPLVEAKTGAEQQNLAQQQIVTKREQDIQGALGDLQNYQNPEGGFDYNGWMSNSVSKKFPLAAQTAFDIRNKNIGSLVSGAYKNQTPIVATPEGIGLAMGNKADKSANSNNPFDSVPTAPGGVPFNTLPPTATTIKDNQPYYVGAPLGGQAGSVPSGAGLGQEVAANVTSQESAKSGTGLRTRADMVPQQKALLANLDTALDQFSSGPGADWTKVQKAMTNRFSPIGNVFDPKAIASQEEFTKQAVQLAQSQFQALGGTGTDSKLDSAMHTSPNDALTNLGNKGIIAMLKGNEDAIAVKNREWQAWKKSNNDPNGASYDSFSTAFNQSFDPRVFQSKYMSADDRAKMLKGMDKDELNRFKQSYNEAHNKGWVK